MINPAIEEGLTSLGLSVGGTGAQYSKKGELIKKQNDNRAIWCMWRKVSRDKNMVP